MRHAIGQIATGAALVTAALVCALPWTATDVGHQPPLAGLGAALPAILVFAFAYWRPDLMTAGAAFLTGLFVDATTGSPLGFWSLLYLLCLGMARFAHNRLDAPSLVGGWITCLLAALLASGAGWATRSVYLMQLASWSEIARPLLLATLLFPIVAGGFIALSRAASPAEPMRTGRRRLDTGAE